MYKGFWKGDARRCDVDELTDREIGVRIMLRLFPCRPYMAVPLSLEHLRLWLVELNFRKGGIKRRRVSCPQLGSPLPSTSVSDVTNAFLTFNRSSYRARTDLRDRIFSYIRARIGHILPALRARYIRCVYAGSSSCISTPVLLGPAMPIPTHLVVSPTTVANQVDDHVFQNICRYLKATSAARATASYRQPIQDIMSRDGPTFRVVSIDVQDRTADYLAYTLT